MVVVMLTALPWRSTMDTWLVEGSGAEASVPLACGAPPGRPAVGTPSERAGLMRLARCAR